MPPSAGLKTDSQALPSVAGVDAWVAWSPLLLLPAIAIAGRNRMPAWLFMWALTFALFLGLKWQTWRQARNRVPHSVGRSLAYLLAWPGMDADAFLNPTRRASANPRLREWIWAAAKTIFGIALLWIVARQVRSEHDLIRGWIGLFGLVVVLHFGSFHLIALFWQSRGIDAQPIMASPILSKTLSEFWGRRWNLGFRQLAHELIFRPLHRRIGVPAAGLLVFLASGLIHDLVISFPARGGYGLPTAYFLLQGFAVMLERSRFGRTVGLQSGWRAWIFLLAITAAPAFWLFHPPFVERVIIPFMDAIHAL